MRRAHPSEQIMFCFAILICAKGPLAVRPAQADRATGARSTGLISDRRQVPADPLAGLPEEEVGQSGRGRAKNGQGARGHDAGGKATCQLEAKAENEREVGDLRAAVAVIQRGPRSEPCTAAQIAVSLRLRLSIDGGGKITAVERLSGDEKLGEDIGRRLVGQVSLSKVTAATTGVAQIGLRQAR
jgi:hypothetical protein